MNKPTELYDALTDFLKDAPCPVIISEHSVSILCRLYDYIHNFNEKLNLIADSSWDQFLYRHIIDSVAPLKFLTFNSGNIIVDIGSGAGFPGMPLAILRPDINIISVESIAKKARYQESAASHLGLANFTVLNDRIENLGRETLRETADIVVVRALSGFSTLLEYSIPLLKTGGKAVIYKGKGVEEELTGCETVFSTLNCTIVNQQNYSIPKIKRVYTLITIEKTGLTPSNYPRNAGIPSKRPL